MTDQTADERTVSRQAYFTDLTDEQWGLVEPLLPAAKPGGRPRACRSIRHLQLQTRRDRKTDSTRGMKRFMLLG